MAITDEIPKSRITLTYRTEVRGQPEEVSLPFRVLIMGDLSGGTSRDRKVDLDQRQIRGLDGKNLDAVMADMNMVLRLTVPNKINPQAAGDDLPVELPVRGIKSLSPAEIARNVPRIRALLLLKKLLLEAQANLDNRKDFRKLVRALATDKAAIGALLKQLEGYETFKLPAPGGAGGAGEAPAGGAGGAPAGGAGSAG
ncbi:MAG TPA: type VI secretion system contractile sheath small subunit [Polyangiaceae bacterium]|nr:type VI secretion system contractile sheath small subunit [Polyangiaceae bacterium]